jgi:hypothetical protein
MRVQPVPKNPSQGASGWSSIFSGGGSVKSDSVANSGRCVGRNHRARRSNDRPTNDRPAPPHLTRGHGRFGHAERDGIRRDLARSGHPAGLAESLGMDPLRSDSVLPEPALQSGSADSSAGADWRPGRRSADGSTHFRLASSGATTFHRGAAPSRTSTPSWSGSSRAPRVPGRAAVRRC